MDVGHDSSVRGLFLKTGCADRLTILGGGNVGVGITTPTVTLQVEGVLSCSGDFFSNGDFHAGNPFDFFNVGGSAKSIRVGGIMISESYSAGTVSRNVLETQGDGEESLFGGHLALFSPKRNPKLMIGSVYTSSAHLTVEGDIS